jgi:hypothetical protein
MVTGRGIPGCALAGVGLLAAGVAGALYLAGGLHQPDYTYHGYQLPRL